MVATGTTLGVIYGNGGNGGSGIGSRFNVNAESRNFTQFLYEHTNGRTVSSSLSNRGPNDEVNIASFSINVGGKQFDFGLDQENHDYSFNAHGNVLDLDDITALKEHSNSLSTFGQSQGRRSRNQWNTMAIEKMSEFLEQMPVGHPFLIVAPKTPLKVTKYSVQEKIDMMSRRDEEVPALIDTQVVCDPPLHYQNTGTGSDFVCPKFGTYTGTLHPNNNGGYEGDDGTSCMPPSYGSSYTRYAVYDTQGQDAWATEHWLRYHGGYTSQCSGRCGGTCSWFDQEAMWDCFDHDACVDSQYSDGSPTGGDEFYCGDELNNAFDDYMATIGSVC